MECNIGYYDKHPDKHLSLLMNSTLMSPYICAKAVYGDRTFPEPFFQTVSLNPMINTWKYMLTKDSNQPLHNQACLYLVRSHILPKVSDVGFTENKI